MADFIPIVEKTFVFEGGYQAFPNDSANYNSLKQLVGTNNGISAIAYETYLKRPPSVADMKAITKDIAEGVYKKLFWDKIHGDEIHNQSMAHLIFDSFIASGGTGLKLVRIAINQTAGSEVVKVNSVQSLSPGERDWIWKLPQDDLFTNIKNVRAGFYHDLVRINPDKYGMFIKGWLNRLAKIIFVPYAVTKFGPDGKTKPEFKKKST